MTKSVASPTGRVEGSGSSGLPKRHPYRPFATRTERRRRIATASPAP